MISVNNQSPKRQMANRKTINIPSTSLASTMTDIIKDEELMPPPSIAHKPEYVLQCDNSNSIINTTRKFLNEFIPYAIFIFIVLFWHTLIHIHESSHYIYF